MVTQKQTVGWPVNVENMGADGYKTIAAPAEAALKERHSRFLAFAYPVVNEAEAKAHLKNLRAQFPDATHICYAFRLGSRGDNWAASDNGEPNGSAGRPILGRMMAAGVSDCLVAVVRWFGGKKLGVPGLIAAYKAAASDVLAAAQIVDKTETPAAVATATTVGAKRQSKIKCLIR